MKPVFLPGKKGDKGDPGFTSYGSLVASLTANVALAAIETKALHVLTPANGRASNYYFIFRAVPVPNDGTGFSAKYELDSSARKSAGVVLVSSVVVRDRRLAPLAGINFSLVAPGDGTIVVNAATTGTAALVTRCDVYLDDST